jgi:hypothetical protein
VTPLSEVAADVAQAFSLTAIYGPTGMQVGWGAPDGDGMHLTPDMLMRPEWRCRCEDWLHEHGYRFESGRNSIHKAYGMSLAGELFTEVNCPWPEAPGRLVSSVWRCGVR